MNTTENPQRNDPATRTTATAATTTPSACSKCARNPGGALSQS